MLTAGDVIMYKDLESDFTDIKSTEPVFMSKGSISEIVKFLPKIVTEAKNLKQTAAKTILLFQ